MYTLFSIYIYVMELYISGKNAIPQTTIIFTCHLLRTKSFLFSCRMDRLISPPPHVVVRAQFTPPAPHLVSSPLSVSRLFFCCKMWMCFTMSLVYRSKCNMLRLHFCWLTPLFLMLRLFLFRACWTIPFCRSFVPFNKKYQQSVNRCLKEQCRTVPHWRLTFFLFCFRLCFSRLSYCYLQTPV